MVTYDTWTPLVEEGQPPGVEHHRGEHLEAVAGPGPEVVVEQQQPGEEEQMRRGLVAGAEQLLQGRTERHRPGEEGPLGLDPAVGGSQPGLPG